MKKLIIILLSILIIVSMVIGFITLNKEAFYSESQITKQEATDAINLLDSSLSNGRNTYFEYLDQYTLNYGTAVFQTSNELIDLSYEAQSTLNVDVKEAGLYHIDISYEMAESVLNNASIAIKINGETPFDEARMIDLPLLWHDQTKDFQLDSYGDEALPLQLKEEGFIQIPLYNNMYYTAEPLLFYFEAGINKIEIENVSSSQFKLEHLSLYQPEKLPTYDEYYRDEDIVDQKIVINANDYSGKNSSYVRLFSFNSPSVSPYDPVDKKLNIIAGDSWYDPGKRIYFEFEVEEAGNYNFALHHLPMKQDFKVFRTLRIDGEIPFEEMKSFPYGDTYANKMLYETVGNDLEDYAFYLEKGHHTLSLTADYEPIADDVKNLQLVIDHINEFALDIKKITGREVDRNRTWKLTEYLPETTSYLKAYDTVIKYALQETVAYAPNDYNSSSLSYLQKALVKLEKMLKKPDELPLYFEDLYSGSGSVNQMLGDAMEALTEQPLSLNELTFYSGDFEFKANASIFEKLAANFQGFASSFTSDKYVVRNDDEMLNVWVNRPITHVDTLQKLVDSEFTPKTGIKVKISVMPDANKIILASAAGEAPDIAMGLLSYMPFDLAIRGAAYDLSSFDDFWEVSERFTPGAYVPYILEDKVYALPETLEFFTTVYRKDIFNSLDLEVPNTWQEVTELLPELQRYGMNYFHPIAGGGSLKWFYQTSPFIYQNDGVLYSEDGLKSAIDQPNSVKGLEFLTKLFTMYSLPEQEPLFYNSFRYGTLPIGIADFVTYMQIKNAATELVGQWALAPYPGTEDEEGNINRWYIANGRGSVILEDTKKANESWEFLKWWTSENVQTTYSYTLQSIYGPEYLWLSSNIEAVKNSPIDIQDKEVILEQIKWLRDVPRTPGQYMLERGISDIWNKSVYDGVPTRIAIDRQVITINREIRKKMIEFGYLDEQGNVIKPYTIRDIDWIEEQIETRGKGYE